MSYNWIIATVGYNATARDALKIIDSEALRMALVVDDNMTLLGVITDGDIRRGILAGSSLDKNVSLLMNSNPIVVAAGSPRTYASKLMKEHNLLGIPRVQNGRLVGFESLYDSLDIETLDNPIFIMAGGFGSRLHPLTENCPKPLLKLGDKPLLEIILEQFIAVGFVNFYISTHFLPEMIQDYFGDGSKWQVSIQYVHEEKPLGTGGALGLLPKDIIDCPMIMVNGDILSKIDYRALLQFHNKENSVATMCVRDYEIKVPYGVVHGLDNKIIAMEEKPSHRFFINAGIYVLNPSVFKSVEPNVYLDMPSLLQRYLDMGIDVSMFPIHEYWLDIGQPADYRKARIDVGRLDF